MSDGAGPVRRVRRDLGSAGLLLVWVAAAVLAVTAGVLAWAAAVTARHRAGQAADLAALAAAGAWATGAAAPCRAAVRVTARSAAVLDECRLLADGSVLVVVHAPVTPSGRLAGVRVPPARARARAGGPEAGYEPP